eukprot:6508978-Lingulodinium_polyedra.AAC.1
MTASTCTHKAGQTHHASRTQSESDGRSAHEAGRENEVAGAAEALEEVRSTERKPGKDWLVNLN